jgi:SAM-dependent methyltransferase
MSGFHVGTGDMESDWDARARRNSRFFIAVDDAGGLQSFDASGERHVELLLRGVPWRCTWRALEIGCGIGRILKPLSRRLESASGVDISEEMIRQANLNLSNVSNVHVTQTRGDLAAFDSETFDFVYSYRVFQHISERAAIEMYVQEAARVLKRGGYFRFQLCTSVNAGGRSTSGGTWFGVLFRPEDIPLLVKSAGLTLISVETEQGDGPQSLWRYQLVTCTHPL